jgi:hypothetical protein
MPTKYNKYPMNSCKNHNPKLFQNTYYVVNIQLFNKFILTLIKEILQQFNTYIR